MKNPLLSICIPAYKREKAVIRTLKSIYSDRNLQNISLNDFEVIVSDNDPDMSLSLLRDEFKYKNFYYYSTHCIGFMNSYYVLNYAKGDFLKLHNSQELWQDGSLLHVLNIIRVNRSQKKMCFFTNSLLKQRKLMFFNDFDSFMNCLSYFSSWSNGFSIWREDYINVKDKVSLNELFPHTSILLTQFFKSEYIVDDTLLFRTQFIHKRGGHNKFHAFAYEYPSLIQKSYLDNHISIRTKKNILDQVLYEYLPLLYFNVKILRIETYESAGFKRDLEVFFPIESYKKILLLSLVVPFKILWRKILLSFLRCI